MRAFLTILFIAFSACGLPKLTACNATIPPDYAPNYADLGYRSIEFVVKSDLGRPEVTQLGNATVLLYEGDTLNDKYIDINAPYQGVLTFYSQGCAWINYSIRYNYTTRLMLDQLMLQPTNCQIRITEVADAIDGLQHDVHEIGVIDVYVLPKGKNPFWISYQDSSQFGSQMRQYLGNAAIQRPIGQYTSSDYITLTTASEGGVMTINSSCGIPKLSVNYTGSAVTLNLRQLFAQGFKADGMDCDFYFMAVPKLEPQAYYGKVMVSTYKPTLIKLEYPPFTVKSGYLTITGASYAAINCINNICSSTNTVQVKYNPEMLYWIRSLTVNGRKSIYAIKNAKVVWW